MWRERLQLAEWLDRGGGSVTTMSEVARLMGGTALGWTEQPGNLPLRQ